MKRRRGCIGARGSIVGVGREGDAGNIVVHEQSGAILDFTVPGKQNRQFQGEFSERMRGKTSEGPGEAADGIVSRKDFASYDEGSIRLIDQLK